MGLREVGAPLARPRHTWETGRGKERAAVAKKAEGGRDWQLAGGDCLGGSQVVGSRLLE